MRAQDEGRPDAVQDLRARRGQLAVSINGTYAFSAGAAAASAGAHLAWRIVDRGSVNAPKVPRYPGNEGCASIRFAVAAPAGQRVVVAKQVFFGWSTALRGSSTCACTSTSCSYGARWTRAARPTSRRARPRTSRRSLGQITTGPGEWQLEWSVDGIWGRWPGTLAARDGSTFPGTRRVDFYVPRGKAVDARDARARVRLRRAAGLGRARAPDAAVPAHERGRQFERRRLPGRDHRAFRSRRRALGRHVANASTAGSTCPPSNMHGCYQLTYTVSRVR